MYTIFQSISNIQDIEWNDSKSTKHFSICDSVFNCSDYLVHFADVNKTLIQLQLYVHGPPPGKEFIIDCFHMTALELDDSWKKKALSRIESFRKSSLTLNVKSFSGNYNNLTLEVGLQLNSCVLPVDVEGNTVLLTTIVIVFDS